MERKKFNGVFIVVFVWYEKGYRFRQFGRPEIRYRKLLFRSEIGLGFGDLGGTPQGQCRQVHLGKTGQPVRS